MKTFNEYFTESDTNQKVAILGKLGLVSPEDVNLLKISMKSLEDDKPLTLKQKTLIVSVYTSLIDIITGDPTIFSKVKKDLKN